MRIFTLGIMLLMGCSIQQKSFEKGNFNKSYRLALKKLIRGKDIATNEAILNQSIAGILEAEHSKKSFLINSSKVDEVEEGILINHFLQEIIREAAPYNKGRFQPTSDSLIAEEKAARAYCANTYFQKGTTFFDRFQKSNNKKFAREAFHHFEKSKHYGYDDRDQLNTLIQESFEAGQVIYSVNLNCFLPKESNRSFKKFIPNATSVVDGTIHVSYSHAWVHESKSSTCKNFEGEIRNGYSVKIIKKTILCNGEYVEVEVEEQVPNNEAIEGQVHIEAITKSADMDARVNVTAHTQNCTLSSRSFSESFECTYETFDLSGDERAIPSQYKMATGISACESNSDFSVQGDLEDALEGVVCRWLRLGY